MLNLIDMERKCSTVPSLKTASGATASGASATSGPGGNVPLASECSSDSSRSPPSPVPSDLRHCSTWSGPYVHLSSMEHLTAALQYFHRPLSQSQSVRPPVLDGF